MALECIQFVIFNLQRLGLAAKLARLSGVYCDGTYVVGFSKIFVYTYLFRELFFT